MAPKLKAAARAVPTHRRRALELLAASGPDGCTEAILLTQSFTTA
jgi:hypothetical protein